MADRTYDRRVFLARTGVLGMALAAPTALVVGHTSPASAGPVEDLVAWLRSVLQQLSSETFDAVVAFVAPGADGHSWSQGTPRPEPGAIATDAGAYTMDVFDRYIPFPDQLSAPLMLEAARRSGDVPAELPTRYRGLGRDDAQRMDGALTILIENDETIPISILVALLLNATATLIDPGLLLRPSRYSSQFAKLTFREKARVLADLESPQPRLVALVRPLLGGALTGELQGLVKLLALFMLALPGLGAYSEWQVFDPSTKTLRRRPIGWELTGYLPGRRAGVEGHADFLGYYQGRS